ncbi:MAG: inositol-3-phosphate synthase, partial [Myxococcota bacterium]
PENLVTTDARLTCRIDNTHKVGAAPKLGRRAVAKDRLDPFDIHIGPSDYVAWQKDNKVCFLRMEWRGWGDVPMHVEARLHVEDSPNSAGVAIDAIRLAKLALDRGLGGPVEAASAYLMKHPPRQMRDTEAHRLINEFIAS